MAVTPRDIARAAAKAAGQAFVTAAQFDDVEAAAQAAIVAAAGAGTEVAEIVAAISQDLLQGKFPGAETGDAGAVHIAAADSAEAALSLKQGGTQDYRAAMQAAMPKSPPGSTPWWSKLLGCPGRQWRVRSDCMMAIMFINDGPMPSHLLIGHLTRGDRCVQVERAQMFLHPHSEGKTAILKMRVEPSGWIAVAMRGAENYGFLEMDDDVEREDRTDEGHGLQWPGRFLPSVGRPNTDLVNAHLDPRGTCQYLAYSASHAPAALLVPSSALPSSAGAQSACWLAGHTLVWKQWSATDGDCCVCKKPLGSDGTGCANCPVKCCKNCNTPPHPCRLGSLNRKTCFSCQQPVIPGLETLSGRTLFCATCQPRGTAADSRQSVVAADVGMENEPAGSVTAKRKADCAFGETLPRKPLAEASPGALRQRAELRPSGPLVLPPSSSVFPAEPPAAALSTLQPPVLPLTLLQASSASESCAMPKL